MYIQSLQVTAHNTSSTSANVSWNDPGPLTHGIFCAVEISYRMNGSSEKHSVSVASATPEYNLTNLKPYTLYAISARPFTLEGEGKESDEVFVRTAEAGE